MSNIDVFNSLPLRQRKFARTKLGLLNAALEAIRTRSLDEVPAKELADAVSISPASFFNYFPRKADLLTYYIQLWSIEMAWYGREFAAARGGLAAIEEVFAMSAARVAENPAPMGEIIAAQARQTGTPEFHEITLAERLLAFPELADIDNIEGKGLDTLLPPLIARAIKAGELPKRTDRQAVLMSLATIFLGLPVILRRAPAGTLGKAYHAQLQLLWKGLRK